MSIEKGHRPTPEQMKKGPVVKLFSERWAGMSWSPHGLAYNVVFDEDGFATVLEEHWEKWVTPEVALYAGIRPAEKTKKVTTKKEKSDA